MSKDRDIAFNVIHRHLLKEENKEIKIYVYFNGDENIKIRFAEDKTFETFDNAVNYIIDYYKKHDCYDSREVTNIDNGFKVKIFYNHNDKNICEIFEVVEK